VSALKPIELQQALKRVSSKTRNAGNGEQAPYAVKPTEKAGKRGLSLKHGLKHVFKSLQRSAKLKTKPKTEPEETSGTKTKKGGLSLKRGLKRVFKSLQRRSNAARAEG